MGGKLLVYGHDKTQWWSPRGQFSFSKHCRVSRYPDTAAVCGSCPVPREEDYGIDIIGTLLRRNGKVYVAEDSLAVQIKTRTSANFPFNGDGIRWIRELNLPYFPVVAALDSATLSLFTLNSHRTAFLPHFARS